MTTISTFKLERERLLNEVKKATPGVEALELLRKLRSEFDNAIDDYRNSLTILGDTTYEDRKHFLLELIQNADDAIYQEEDTNISFTIHQDSLEISYNETGFTTGDVIAITGTGASTKTANKLSANSFIGEKGIGFKSVFALAKEVSIESGPWRFKLNKENYIVPELIDSSSPMHTKGTKLRVYFSNSESVTIVAEELQKLVTKQLESFLFLQKLKTFTYHDARNLYSNHYQLSLLPNKGDNSINLQTTPGNVERNYTIYEEEIEFPGALVGVRWERLGSQHSLKRKMAVAAISNSSSQQVTEGRLFCYLPTEVKLPIPVFLQIDGHLKADRERLHDINNNSWNEFLLDHVPRFLLRAILKWREDKEMVLRLPEFIPDTSGWDQLKPVFENFIKKCHDAPWVKTYEGWSAPTQTIIAESFWYKWFEEYPEFRIEAEKILGKKFMISDWAANTSWKSKWKTYSINNLSAFQIADILCFADIPDELLAKDGNLVNLYGHLIRHHSNIKVYDRNNFIKRLFLAKIFPLEGGVFGPLIQQNEHRGKMYWMSGRTRRSSGLEGIIDVKIINPEYTYTPNIYADISEEKKLEAREIHMRNEQVKQVLRFMDVPEFSDERLLSELQVPFLLENEKEWNKEQIHTIYRVLRSIFDVYQGKRTFDEGYLNQIGKLSEAYVLGANGKIKKMYQTILHEKVRLFEEDHLYANTGFDSIHLPQEWLNPEFYGENQDEKEEFYFKQLRNFLIHIGVANGPRYIFKERKYVNGFEFRETEESLFRTWAKKINDDYTSSNAISLKSVSLDAATIQLLQNDTVSHNIAKGLYDEWLNKFSRSLDMDDSLYYRFDPHPGFLKTSYKRRENRNPIIPDTHWAGVNANQIPLITIDGRLTKSERAFVVKQSRGLDHALKFFDFVVENEMNGYHSKYLASLGVRTLSVDELNRKWKEVQKDSYEKLMKVMYELSQVEMDLSDLIIYDKATEKFRSIRSFKLGKPVSASTPYIEEQYGHYGKMVGEKLGLMVDSEVTPLLHILDTFFSNSQTPQWIQSNFSRIFQQWSNLRVDDRGNLIHHITELRKANNVDNEMLVIFNDENLYHKLHTSNTFVIHLECDAKGIHKFKLAAKGLGFVLLEDIGTVVASESAFLDEQDVLILYEMFEKYIEDLEEDESARLFEVLEKIGGKADFLSRIKKSKQLTKTVYGITIPVTFPHYDQMKECYFVSMKDSLFETAARLLSSFGFTTYRSANRDFKEIYEKLIRLKAATIVTIQEDKGRYPSPFTDVTAEYELSESDNSSSSTTTQQPILTINSAHGIPEHSFGNSDFEGNQSFEESIAQKPVSQRHEQGGKVYDKETNDGNHKIKDHSHDDFTGSNIKKLVTGVDSERELHTEEIKKEQLSTNLNKVQIRHNQHITLEEVLEQLSENMVKDFNVQDNLVNDEWKIAIDPEVGEQIRASIGQNLESELKNGPEYKGVKERKKKGKINILDKSAQHPKEFLEHEYNGRCQVCSTQLKLPNGKTYFEVFRIQEGKGEAWWTNRPFNTLSLCPNCHALAKHGGAADFSSILKEADLVRQQLTFTQEVESYRGDYYVLEIVHNGESKQMVLSSLHIEYFAALLEHVRQG